MIEVSPPPAYRAGDTEIAWAQIIENVVQDSSGKVVELLCRDVATHMVKIGGPLIWRTGLLDILCSEANPKAGERVIRQLSCAELPNRLFMPQRALSLYADSR